MHILNLRGVFIRDILTEIPEKIYSGLDNISLEDYQISEKRLDTMAPTNAIEYINQRFTNYIDVELKSQSMEKWPPYYIRNDLWPRKTMFQCMHCSLKIPGMPCFIPIGISNRLIRNSILGLNSNQRGHALITEEYSECQVFERYGKFCSFPCAAAYIDTTFDRELMNNKPLRKWELQSMLLTLCKQMTGTYRRHIPLALRKTELIRYGGELTDEQYHAHNDRLLH
jgi:hypothetical protein